MFVLLLKLLEFVFRNLQRFSKSPKIKNYLCCERKLKNIFHHPFLQTMDRQEYKDFTGNWMCIQTLGEGAYGEVKLLKHKISGECVAAKIVDLKKQKDAEECVRKEVRIQSILNHPNIIKLYGRRREPDQSIEFIYLEYAAGGELFNKIDPDIGMPYEEAQNYMKQLLAGVEYLHQKGIAHRDIKPENLLLDAHGNLKIIDFGMATVFRLKGKERLLDKKCGTLPYVAPEVLRKPYLAQPADIWSCGIVLIAMVAGELPWHEPTHDCEEYMQWVSEQYLLNSPWCKFENTLLSLTRKILTPDPCNRPSVEQIRHHPWMLMNFAYTEQSIDVMDGLGGITRKLSYMNDARKTYEPPTVTLSQPVPRHVSKVIPENVTELLKTRDNVCFSQPTQNDDLFISSQMQFTQTPLTQNDFQHLIRRMTRFFVKTNCGNTILILGSLLDRMLYTWNTDPSGVFTISTVDSRKMQLIFKANIIDMDGKLLLDFRLSKGCGLEFKRRFIKLKKCLSEIILHNTV